MNMKHLKTYMITGALFVSILGTLCHFVYEWSENNVFVGLFVPTNESIWEHTKLLFFPMLLYSLYLDKKIGTKYPCVRSAMTAGTLLGVILIIFLYYTYSGMIGYRISYVDISIFYISVIFSFYAAYRWTLFCDAEPYYAVLQFLQLIMICLYIIFTFYSPEIPLFISPI